MRKIIIDCERMKTPYNGLYTFCLYLCKALQKIINDNKQLHFYLPEKRIGVFGEKSNYLIQKWWHKIYMPFASSFDLWHGTFQSTNYFPVNSNIKKILTVHDINFMHDPSISKERKYKYLSAMQRKINMADAVTAISSFSLQEIKNYLEISDDKGIVIYNGCSVNDFIKPKVPVYAPDKPFLFTIGTIVEKKNFHVLPALLKGNDFVLIIGGLTLSAAYKKKIEDESERWGVSKRVVFTGGIGDEEKYWYMQNCTAFLFPSLSEGFGFPVIEAMHFERPVLLSTYSSLPEIGGDSAYYFKSFDMEDMQLTLYSALDDYNNNNDKRKKIKAHADSFKWEEAAKQYCNLYSGLLSK